MAAKKMAVKRDNPNRNPIDLPMFFIIVILLAFGLIMMFSASYAWATYEADDGMKYIKRQAAFCVFGLFVMFIASKVDYHIFRHPVIAYGLYFGAVALLVLVLFIGTNNGTFATRWLAVPGLGTFQPSEIAKFALIVIFAYLISMNYSKLNKFSYGVVPFLTLLAPIVALLMLEPHLSGTIIICAIGIIMMFVGGTRPAHLGLLAAVGAAGLVAIVFYKMNVEGFDYFSVRIASWRDPFSDGQGDTWQTKQSLIAIGSGGIFGLGLGNSRQKYLYLPAAENDFVFAIVCEELGLIGAMLVILLFLAFIFRGFYIATKSPDKFGMMLAAGLVIQIGLQALLNIAVVTNSIPNTGVSLPFFSYGGTALVMQLAQMGVLLNISRHTSVVVEEIIPGRKDTMSSGRQIRMSGGNTRQRARG